MEKISRDSGEPPWMQLRDALREAILSGEITGRLPSAERIGQEQDGMAANTVSKALRALRDEGLVTSRKGWGWFVVPEGERPAPPAEDGGPGRGGKSLSGQRELDLAVQGYGHIVNELLLAGQVPHRLANRSREHVRNLAGVLEAE